MEYRDLCGNLFNCQFCGAHGTSYAAPVSRSRLQHAWLAFLSFRFLSFRSPQLYLQEPSVALLAWQGAVRALPWCRPRPESSAGSTGRRARIARKMPHKFLRSKPAGREWESAEKAFPDGDIETARNTRDWRTWKPQRTPIKSD